MVLITGIFSCSANTVSASDALLLTAECPARTTGRLDLAISTAARSMESLSANSLSKSGRFKSFLATPSGTFSLATSSGIQIWAAPGLSLSAYLKASLTISFTVSALMMVFVRFVMGRNRLSRSRY